MASEKSILFLTAVSTISIIMSFPSARSYIRRLLTMAIK